ncbi:uncharacterized protein [Dermacentor albipictus]|uniref:uncharacterized protein n=1 Tax=Dermacentor albipictus TaxID=60249 RepID=UPI0031FCF7CF
MDNGESTSTSNGNASEASTATPKTNANAEPYCEKYYSLLKRYNAIQKQNYHLMYRIQRVKKLTTRLTKEKRFLTQRLNNYKQEKQAAMSMTQYAMDDRQFRRIKQEPMDPQAHHVVNEYLCRKRKEKSIKTS